MDWKTFGKKLLFPPLWLIFLVTAVSVPLLTVVFLKGWEERFFAYGIYVLSAYALCVLTAWCVRFLPGRLRRLRQQFLESPFGSRYTTDHTFRAKVSLYASFTTDLLYVIINLLSWLVLRSWWFVILAAYYGILAVMRSLLVRFVRGNVLGEEPLAEWKRARICACILLLVNLSLSAAVLMILYQGKGYEQHGLLIYVIALHTFYSAIQAVIDVVKYRRMESPVLSTAKIVSLCSALVSMLNLETAMFAQFGADMPMENQHLMIMLTGGGVSLAVITLSVGLTVQATKNIRRENNGRE